MTVIIREFWKNRKTVIKKNQILLVIILNTIKLHKSYMPIKSLLEKYPEKEWCNYKCRTV
jgi:hypothetical protein